jgi:hypothetical protein
VIVTLLAAHDIPTRFFEELAVPLPSKTVKINWFHLVESQLFDMESLYARLGELTDKRKPRGIRYQLITILIMMVMAKLSGEDTPSAEVQTIERTGKRQALKVERARE